MENGENDLETDFKSWNPMLEDFNNTELNQYYSGPGVGLNELSQNQPQKQPRLGGIDANTDLRGKIPYLVIKGTAPEFNEITIRSILKHVSIHHCFYTTNSKTHFVYFNAIADLEEAFRTLEKVDYIPTVIVGNSQAKKSKYVEVFQQDNNNEQKNEDHSSLPESANTINMDARTIKISEYNPNHPIFGFNHLVHPDIYKKEDSFLKSFDPLQRLKDVRDEHVLERYNIFRELPGKLDLVGSYEYRSGRAIQKFSDNFKLENPINVGQQMDFSGWNLKNCYICGRMCTSHCSQCLTFYCSLRSCQEKLYDEHKLKCAKGIALEYKPPIIVPPKKIFQNKAPISGSKVELTAFQQSNVVYLRSLENGPNIGYFNVLKKVFHHGKNAEKYQVTPNSGDLVLVKLENEYLRALVLNADTRDSIYVTYIDYGNVDQQPVDNFYVISKELAVLPCHVIAVKLKDVPYRFMSLQYRSFLYRLLKTHVLKIKYERRAFDFSKGLHTVELFDDVLRMNINRNLIALLTPRELNDSNEIFFENSLKRFSLPTGQTIQLAITDNSLIKAGFLSCTTKELAHEIDKIQIDIQAYGEAQESLCYAPRVNELCIVKYEADGKWCRGRCLELVGDGHPSIFFIDYGNIGLVPVENIRKYPAMFTYPILTEDVFLDGFDANINDYEVMKNLQDVFPIGGIITCELYKKDDDDSLYIDMANI